VVPLVHDLPRREPREHDEAADLALLRAYYADKVGRYPEKAGDIRFKNRRENQPRS